MKAYCGSGGIAPRIFTSALVGGELSASRPGRFSPQRKSPWYPSDRRLSGPQSRSGRDGEEKNSQPLPGLEPRSSIPWPTATPLSYSAWIYTSTAVYVFMAWCLTTLLLHFILEVNVLEGDPVTSIGRVPRVADGGSHQIWWGGPNSCGNKDPWTNSKGNEMGHTQELAHPRE
jgi:hypothetical protein